MRDGARVRVVISVIVAWATVLLAGAGCTSELAPAHPRLAAGDEASQWTQVVQGRVLVGLDRSGHEHARQFWA